MIILTKLPIEPIFGWESYTKILYTGTQEEERERFSALREVISTNMKDDDMVTYGWDMIDQIEPSTWTRFIYSKIPNGQKTT